MIRRDRSWRKNEWRKNGDSRKLRKSEINQWPPNSLITTKARPQDPKDPRNHRADQSIPVKNPCIQDTARGQKGLVVPLEVGRVKSPTVFGQVEDCFHQVHKTRIQEKEKEKNLKSGRLLLCLTEFRRRKGLKLDPLQSWLGRGSTKRLPDPSPPWEPAITLRL